MHELQMAMTICWKNQPEHNVLTHAQAFYAQRAATLDWRCVCIFVNFHVGSSNQSNMLIFRNRQRPEKTDRNAIAKPWLDRRSENGQRIQNSKWPQKDILTYSLAFSAIAAIFNDFMHNLRVKMRNYTMEVFFSALFCCCCCCAHFTGNRFPALCGSNMSFLPFRWIFPILAILAILVVRCVLCVCVYVVVAAVEFLLFFFFFVLFLSLSILLLLCFYFTKSSSLSASERWMLSASSIYSAALLCLYAIRTAMSFLYRLFCAWHNQLLALKSKLRAKVSVRRENR